MNFMTLGLRLMVVAVALLCLDRHASAADTNSVTQAARRRADELVALLRAGKWEVAASYVIIFTGKQDSVARKQMGISKDASHEVMIQKSSAWFKNLYEKVRPGQVVDVRLDTKDPNLVLVTYHHEDLDGFKMRFVDGKWYYTLE